MKRSVRGAIVAAVGLAIWPAGVANADPASDKFLDVVRAYGFYSTDDSSKYPKDGNISLNIAGEAVCALAGQDFSKQQISASMVNLGEANNVGDSYRFVEAANIAFCPTLNVEAIHGQPGPLPASDLEPLARVRQENG